MLRRLIAVCLLAIAPSLTASPLLAGPTLATLKDAVRLYELGLEQRDPVLLLAAARLRKAAPAAPDGWTDWPEYLQAARDAAPGDPLISGLADDITAEGQRGAATGPVHALREIGDTDTIDLPVISGEHAEVYVEGDIGTELDVIVRDPAGQIVCSDIDPSDVAYCSWLPADSATHKVTVTNVGTGGAYMILTN